MSRLRIVQMELFHVGGKGDTLESMMAESMMRLRDSLELLVHGQEAPRVGIKTVIRIRDTVGLFSALVRWTSVLKRFQDRWFLDWPWSWWQRRRYQSIVGLVLLMQGILKMGAPHFLRHALRSPGSVAIEYNDFSFRHLQRNEVYELMVTLEKAKGIWFFLMRSSHLLAPRVEVEAHLM